MDSTNIKDYLEQLQKLCVHCRRSHKCKDHTKLCFAKRITFNIAKMKYKRDLKKGQDNASS